MIDIVSQFIRQNALLSKDALHLVALSGGADSVALLLVLHQLGYSIEAMHCNFNLRGEESQRDEDFCKSLCQRLNIPLHLAHFDTRFYINQHHVSIEMAARELRYNYFRQLQQELGAESICVAHHQDDNAETILLNLVRGTGLAGLTGIKPRNGVIIRPLLCVGRHDIESYLMAMHQDYIVDSSNLVNDVKRNRIRLDIMPILKAMNPSVTDAIIRSAQHVCEAMPLLSDSLCRWKEQCVKHIERSGFTDENDHFQPISISIARLRECPSPKYLLYDILSDNGIPAQMTNQIFNHLDSQTGTSWLVGNRTITIDRGHLLIEPKAVPFRELKIPMLGKYRLCNGDVIVVSEHQKDADFRIDTSPNIAQLDSDSVRFPLTIRVVANGDRFVPFGMNGSKLVSDLLTDRKMTLQQKRNQLCVTDASEQIVWLTGLRISNKHRITSHTIKYVCIRYIKNQ